MRVTVGTYADSARFPKARAIQRGFRPTTRGPVASTLIVRMIDVRPFTDLNDCASRCFSAPGPTAPLKAY